MKTAINITKQEIKWHEENRGNGPSAIWEEGFIGGLKQLLDLFETADKKPDVDFEKRYNNAYRDYVNNLIGD